MTDFNDLYRDLKIPDMDNLLTEPGFSAPKKGHIDPLLGSVPKWSASVAPQDTSYLFGATQDPLTTIEVYCRRVECGDPVPSPWGTQPMRTRRLMKYRGQSRGKALYVCPVCGGERYFRRKWWSGQVRESDG